MKAVHRFFLIFLVSAGFLCFGIDSFAQGKASSNYSFTRLDDLNVSLRIKSIVLDQQGHIWIGGDNGLFRYDGENPQKIDIPYVKDIILDVNHLIVVADNGLFRIASELHGFTVDTLLLSNEQPSPDYLHYPKSAYITKGGDLWIIEDDAMVRYQKNALRRFRFQTPQGTNYLRHSFSLCEDSYGNLWLVGRNGSIFRFNEQTEAFEQVAHNLELRGVSAMISSGDNRIWIGDERGVHEVTVNQKGDILRTKTLHKIDLVWGLQLSDTGELLVVSRVNGIFLISGERISEPFLPDLQMEDALLLGTELWIAAPESVWYGRSTPLQPLSAISQEFIPTIRKSIGNSVLINEGRRLVGAQFSHEGYLLNPITKSFDEVFLNDALQEGGTIYYVSSQAVHSMDLATGQEQLLYKSEDETRWFDNVRLDLDAALWISDRMERPALQVKRSGEIVAWPSLSHCHALEEDPSGNLIAFGHKGQLWKQTGGEFVQLDWGMPEGEEDLTIEDLVYTNELVYLATSQGLFQIKLDEEGNPIKGTLKVLHDQAVINIELDRRNPDCLWFTNENNLFKLEFGEQVCYGKESGVPLNFIISRGLLLDNNQHLWLATSRGLLNMATAEDSSPRAISPKIARLRKGQENITVVNSQLGTFSTTDRILMELTNVGFPKSNRQFLGIIRDEVGDTVATFDGQQVALPNLAPDQYELLLLVQQNGKRISEPTAYTFRIRKPWYLSTVALILYIAITIVLIVLIVRLYNQRLLLSKKKLEAEISSRTADLEKQSQAIISQQKQLIEQKDQLLSKTKALHEAKDALLKAEQKNNSFKREQMRKELSFKSKQLTTNVLNVLEKNEYLLQISEQLLKIAKEKDLSAIKTATRKLGQQTKNTVKQDQRWEEFRVYFEQIHHEFYAKLRMSNPNLSANDLKHCALIRLQISLEDSGRLLGVSSETVRITRYRIQKKTEFSNQQALFEYLLGL